MYYLILKNEKAKNARQTDIQTDKSDRPLGQDHYLKFGGNYVIDLRIIYYKFIQFRTSIKETNESVG